MATPIHKFSPLPGDFQNWDALAAQWAKVSEVFADGAHCESCPYKTRSYEGHGETLRHCAILDLNEMLNPAECPGVAVPAEAEPEATCNYCRGHGEVWHRGYGEEWQERCAFCGGSGLEKA